MKQFISSLFLLALTLQGASAQETPFLTIGEKQYSIDEFNYIYEKNNALTQQPVSKEEYVELFVNYKLKVEEAIAQGYDTLPSFQKELNYYRDELAKPYLSDKKATEEVITEAYEHMRYEVDASHILIKLPQSPTPTDTLLAYKRIAKVKQLLDEGADFEEMVLTYSEGPSAQQSNGRLGYFTAFMMVYPFEKAAYETPVGQVSAITRTSFGYHLIKVHNKRKNKGEILVAHIMRAFPYKASEAIQTQAKIAIDSIYRKLQNGESFNAMVAQFSDDKQTVPNNGKLPWFSTGRMVPEFSEAAFALTENGQISEPVKTQFGYHIIQRLDSRPIKPLDECRDEILQKIKNDERALAGKQATVKRLKREYNFQLNNKGFEQLKKFVTTNSSKDKDNWIEHLKSTDWLVASYDGGQIVSAHFAKEAIRFNLPETGVNDELFTMMWDAFVDSRLIELEKANLENKYPEFKYLMGEYHDGLLIFEISQKEIWNKASNDSLGLADFYARHTDDYVLQEHFDGQLISCQTKGVSKQLKKIQKKQGGIVVDSLDTAITEQIQIKHGPFFKGDEPMVDALVWKAKKPAIDGSFPYVIVDGKVIPGHVQPLNTIRGRVISDYQEEIEQRWINELKQKYNPKVNSFVFK